MTPKENWEHVDKATKKYNLNPAEAMMVFEHLFCADRHAAKAIHECSASLSGHAAASQSSRAAGAKGRG